MDLWVVLGGAWLILGIMWSLQYRKLRYMFWPVLTLWYLWGHTRDSINNMEW